jgi:hypothetical protein
MEVKKLSVEVTAEGQLVSISALLPRNEKLDGSEVSYLIDVLRSGVLQKGTTDAAPAIEAPAEGRRRRAAAEPEKEPETSGEPSGRRRRGAEPAAAEPESPATDQAPVEGRRRRGAATTESPAPQDATASTASPSEPRRRRGAAAEPEAPKAPSDADLVKAATAANEALTKALGKEGQEKILDLMDEYDGTDGKPVTRIDKLKAEDRDDFLKRLKALVADNT